MMQCECTMKFCMTSSLMLRRRDAHPSVRPAHDGAATQPGCISRNATFMLRCTRAAAGRWLRGRRLGLHGLKGAQRGGNPCPLQPTRRILPPLVVLLILLNKDTRLRRPRGRRRPRAAYRGHVQPRAASDLQTSCATRDRRPLRLGNSPPDGPRPSDGLPTRIQPGPTRAARGCGCAICRPRGPAMCSTAPRSRWAPDTQVVEGPQTPN